MENFLDEIPDVELSDGRVTLRLLGKQDAEAVFALVDRNRGFLSRNARTSRMSRRGLIPGKCRPSWRTAPAGEFSSRVRAV